MNTDKITPFQLGCLCFSFMSGFSTLYLLEAKLLTQDVWIANLSAMFVVLILLRMMTYVQRQFPHTNMSGIIEVLFGKWGSKLVFLIYLSGMVSLAVLSLRSISLFYTTAILPKTSPNVILLIVIIVTTYAVSLGLGSIARSVQVILPFFIVAILVMCAFIYRDIDINPFLPQFQHRFPLILYSSLISFGLPFGKYSVMIFIFSEVTNQKKLFKSCAVGVVLSGLYLIMSTYLAMGSLGENMFKTSSYPFFASIQLVKLGEYIERIEIMIIGIWTILILFEIIMVQVVFVKIVGKLFGLKDLKPFILPVSIFFFAIAVQSYVNLADLVTYDTNILPFAIMLPAVVIPVCLVALTWIKKRRGGAGEIAAVDE